MAHDMYGINELLKKYPLVEKAFARMEADMEAAFFPVGGEEAITGGPRRLIEAIDKNIDGSDLEKQALIIGAMYSFSARPIDTDKENFGREYDAATKAVMEDLLAYDKTTVAPASVSRINAALGVCMNGALASTLAQAGGGAALLPPQVMQKIKNELLAEEKKFLPNLNAPRLEALYRKTSQELFALLDPQPKKNPKPGAPKI